jgi:sugar transferase (PEP-CTERM/EpsH1 system associated)
MTLESTRTNALTVLQGPTRGPNVSRPPLIVHVIHHLVVGGMENTLVNLINHTPPERFRHAVICVEDFSDFRHRITSPEVEVIALHRSKVGATAVRKAIYQFCRRWRPTVLHSRNMSGLDALLPSFLARVPVRVHSEHGWDVDNLDGRRWKPALLRRLHSPLVSAYVTVSADLARFLHVRLGIAEKRIHHICNGVDTSRFVPGTAVDKAELPDGFNGPSMLCVGTVGRLQPVKDQATLVHAVARVVAANPAARARLRLVIVGNGPLLSVLQRQVLDLGLQDLVWLPGSSDKVPSLLRAMDLFVLPSLNEGISNTILEAMACGVPVIASRVGGNPELVIPGLNGELFAAGDVQALSTLLQRYLDDPALRQRQALSARQQALERFSLQVMLQRYLKLYDMLAGLQPIQDVTAGVPERL